MLAPCARVISLATRRIRRDPTQPPRIVVERKRQAKHCDGECNGHRQSVHEGLGLRPDPVLCPAIANDEDVVETQRCVVERGG